MGRWFDQARIGAARRFGERHYKLLLTLHLAHRYRLLLIGAVVAVVGVVLVAVSGPGVARLAAQLSWPPVLRWSALLVALGYIARLAFDMVTGARVGTSQPHPYAAPALVIAGIAALLITSLLIG